VNLLVCHLVLPFANLLWPMLSVNFPSRFDADDGGASMGRILGWIAASFKARFAAIRCWASALALDPTGPFGAARAAPALQRLPTLVAGGRTHAD
jgi:hypothetical protein